MSNPLILNNAGDDAYKFLAREWLSKPIYCSFLKIFLPDDTLLSETLEVRSRTSSGSKDNRQISLSNYITSEDADNKIVLIPLTPSLILDGDTYFRIRLPASSQITMLFYYSDQLQILN